MGQSLGTHPKGTAYAIKLEVFLTTGLLHGDPKVRNLNDPIMTEQIPCLYIPMHNSSPMEVAKTLEYLRKHSYDILLRIGGLPETHDVGEGSFFAILCEYPHFLLIEFDSETRQEVGVVTAAHDLDFQFDGIELRLVRLYGDNLGRHNLLARPHPHPVDLTRCTLTQSLQLLVFLTPMLHLNSNLEVVIIAQTYSYHQLALSCQM